MTAAILKFPQRGPFAVTICREDEAWLVVCRQHGWLFGSNTEAQAEAQRAAHSFGVSVVEVLR
jgi:hypothetical protein